MRPVFVLALVSLVFVCAVAEARPSRRTGTTYSSPTQTAVTWAIESAGDDQARCQQEANIMASRRFTGHVGSCIGRFEGVGSGPSPNCNTCTPDGSGLRGLRLTGDASACDSSGRWYRVRSWR